MTLFLYTSSSSSSSSSSSLPSSLYSPPLSQISSLTLQKACAGVSLPFFSPHPSSISLSPHPPFLLFSPPLTHSLLVTPTLFLQDFFSGYLRLSFFKLRCTRGYICSPYINTKRYNTRLRCTRLATLAIHCIHCLQAFVIFPFIIISFFPLVDFTSISIAFDSLACPHCSPVSILAVSLLLQDDLGTFRPFPSRNRLRWEGKGKRGTALLYKYFCRVWRTQLLP